MQPLIKWPGGKSSELAIIKKFIPEYDRYIEPFLGGGALFFDLPPKPSVINDISTNLMLFYSFIKDNNNKFKTCLYTINEEWERLKSSATVASYKLISDYKQYRVSAEHEHALRGAVDIACKEVSDEILKDTSVIKDAACFKKQVSRMITDKVFRTAKNEVRNGKPLSDEDLHANLVTGFTSGYYMYLRDTLNSIERNNDIYIATEYKIAVFYFVREFCYGSMFRYNKAGDFNIPYGGIAYNNKDFKKKIDLLFSSQTQEYLKNTQILTNDFESVLDMAEENDFIFLDPPYDTDFSDYENRRFDESDQRRLEKRLHDTKAKFLLIIKNTPLISQLYQNNGYKIYAFDNRYSYCVKGRNDRNAEHLIITNY